MPLYENIPQTTDSNVVMVCGSFNTNTSGNVTLATGFGVTSITDSAVGVFDLVLAEKYPYLLSGVACCYHPGSGDFFIDNAESGIRPRVTYAASTGTLTITLYDTTDVTNVPKDPLIDDTPVHWMAFFARANASGNNTSNITIA